MNRNGKANMGKIKKKKVPVPGKKIKLNERDVNGKINFRVKEHHGRAFWER